MVSQTFVMFNNVSISKMDLIIGLYGLFNLSDLQNIATRLSLKGSIEMPKEESLAFTADSVLHTEEKVKLLNVRNSRKARMKTGDKF